MKNESIQILLNNANAYALLAQSLRSSGISSWIHYHRQMIKCLEQAHNINKTIPFQINGFEEEKLVA